MRMEGDDHGLGSEHVVASERASRSRDTFRDRLQITTFHAIRFSGADFLRMALGIGRFGRRFKTLDIGWRDASFLDMM